MGTAKQGKDNDMVSVETTILKERLNNLYNSRRGQAHRLDKPGANEGIFEYLWDLKEKALLDRKPSVDVPHNWLDQLEQDQDGLRH